MSIKSLHQFLVGANPGDAITDQALMIQRWLREMGFRSDLFAEHIHDELKALVRPVATFRWTREEPWLIFHHSTGSPLVDEISSRPLKLILIYHNVTPSEFLVQVDPAMAQTMKLGRAQLAELINTSELALGDSFFNEQELIELGFKRTGMLPIALDESNYDMSPNDEIRASFSDDRPTILFVGRIAPNKKQEDLIKLIYYYRRIEPSARLVLVGDEWLHTYARWIDAQARNLGLSEAVIMTGRVSQKDLVTYYKVADLYVSMSEHEGFGKPLIESMYLGLPVLAYHCTAVPYTLGQGGVIFNEKHYEALAELVDIMIKDQGLRDRLIAQGKQQAQSYLESTVRQQLHHYLSEINLT